MREERVTINILEWLDNCGWEIVCYDFPQSGTGRLLQPNPGVIAEKNKGGIIPDIVAVKGTIVCFFENKDRYYEADFDKLYELKSSGRYSQSISLLLSSYNITKIVYGIGIPDVPKHIKKSKTQLAKIDFLVSTDDNAKIDIHYDSEQVF